jgi:PII-like signaling protein
MLQAQIFIDKSDFHNTQPVYDYIMQFLLLHHINGATALTGIMGFGSHQQMKRPNELFSFDEPPMVILFIDEAGKVREVLTRLRKEYKGGFIITHHVDLFEA